MGEAPEKKGKDMTAGGGAAAESQRREFERVPDTKLVPTGLSKHASQRRSQRVFFRASVIVYGQHPDGGIYSENTHTVIVSAHGAMVMIAAEVQSKERLLLINQQTTQEVECYVASLGELKEGKREVGIGFVEPNPRFWGMNFPPEDWDPALRKKPTGKVP